MSILHRLLKLIVILYISGKWVWLVAGLLVSLGPLFNSELHWFLSVTSSFYGVSIVTVPLILLSVFEWIIFGRLTWSYNSLLRLSEINSKAQEKKEIEKAMAFNGTAKNYDSIEYMNIPIADSESTPKSDNFWAIFILLILGSALFFLVLSF